MWSQWVYVYIYIYMCVYVSENRSPVPNRCFLYVLLISRPICDAFSHISNGNILSRRDGSIFCNIILDLCNWSWLVSHEGSMGPMGPASGGQVAAGHSGGRRQRRWRVTPRPPSLTPRPPKNKKTETPFMCRYGDLKISKVQKYTCFVLRCSWNTICFYT